MANESTKLPISEQFDNGVQMGPKTRTDVVDHVCCLLCFIHGPALIVQCHSWNKLKRNWKNVITGASKKSHIAASGFHRSSAHPHDDSQAWRDQFSELGPLLCVASEILQEGIIIVFHPLAPAAGTHLDKYARYSAEKSILYSGANWARSRASHTHFFFLRPRGGYGATLECDMQGSAPLSYR